MRGKKTPGSSKKQNLNLWCAHSYWNSIYAVFTTLDIALHSVYGYLNSIYTSLKDLKCTRGCVYFICKYCTILYKGLEHPWILVSVGNVEPMPSGYWEMTTTLECRRDLNFQATLRLPFLNRVFCFLFKVFYVFLSF